MKGVFWDVRRVALVKTDVSEELSASFIRVTRIGELGTTLAVTSSRGISSQCALLICDDTEDPNNNELDR
jgi:hypothetical protein